MDTRRLFRTHTASTLNSDTSSAGFFATRSPQGTTHRAEDVKGHQDDNPSLTKSHKKGSRSRSRSRRRTKVDHMPDRSTSRLGSFTSEFKEEAPSGTTKTRFPTFRRKLLEWEIDQFLNAKVHDDPFARSALPYALRFRGSIFWNLVPQILIVASWGTLIVCISQLKTYIGVSTVLITVLGFVTGLALSFRVNTAYERYNEGRRYWAQLTMTIRNFSRYIWFQIPLRKGHEKSDLLMKVTCLKLLVGFAIALKHHLREELGTDYDDLRPFVAYIPTYARKRADLAAMEATRKQAEKENQDAELERLQAMEESLMSVDMGNVLSTAGPTPLARSNTFNGRLPALNRMGTMQQRAVQASNEIKSKIVNQWFPINAKLSEYLLDREDRISRATLLHGNLPLEILQFLAYYCRQMQIDQGILSPSEVSFFFTQTNTLTEILTGTERILRTPLPLAYNILCNQLAWIFVLMLPFQLVSTLNWVAIPATVIAGYVILGLAAIGLEIENPFGFDPNDLDLNRYCQMISVEVSMTMSYVPYSDSSAWMRDKLNRPLAPVYNGDFEQCEKDLELEDMLRILQQTVEDPSKRWHSAPHGHKSNNTKNMEEESDEKDETSVSTTTLAADDDKKASEDQIKSPHRKSVSSSLRSAASAQSNLDFPVTSPILDSKVISSFMGRPRRPTYEKRPQSVILEDEEEGNDAAREVVVSKSTQGDSNSLQIESEDESDDRGADNEEDDPLEQAQKNLPRLALTVSQLSGLPPGSIADEMVASPSVKSSSSRKSSPLLSAASIIDGGSPVGRKEDHSSLMRDHVKPAASADSGENPTGHLTDKPKSYDMNNEEDMKEIYESLNSMKFLNDSRGSRRLVN
ncbi:Bestrophin, RFP-TM, chloride channel-domain-containing protein [Lipomyces kononenkoae]|uniref:Bestrophin, RFP-TM, chloride channel-domain-containing protein n=1 Tax=Lipomyces kononenkoae TaxID=34357 RepID=A0ACC3TAS0_LIPKO